MFFACRCDLNSIRSPIAHGGRFPPGIFVLGDCGYWVIAVLLKFLDEFLSLCFGFILSLDLVFLRVLYRFFLDKELQYIILLEVQGYLSLQC